jgi:hypothetical protein
MAIKFFNIRSGESRVVKTDPVIADAHIAALWGSSDRSPNVNQGQDFGWRLAPETVVEIERIQQDPRLLESIAVQLGILPDSITETNILQYISAQNDRKVQGLEQTPEDFQKQYEDDIRRIRDSGQMNSGATLDLPPKEQVKPEQLPTDTAADEPSPEQNITDEPITDQVKEATDDARDEGEEDTSDADDGGSEEEKADEAASVEQPAESGSDTTSGPAQVQEVDEGMSRAQLESIAKDAGVDAPSGFANKGELVEAIRQKRSAQ